MSSCMNCGAPSTNGGLFCAFCGRTIDLAANSPRLLEAISIETMGDEASPVIPYGAHLPTSYSDGQACPTGQQCCGSSCCVLGEACCNVPGSATPVCVQLNGGTCPTTCTEPGACPECTSCE
jgi:hypothetical protein